SSRRRHTRFSRDWSSDVCSSDLWRPGYANAQRDGPQSTAPGPTRPQRLASDISGRRVTESGCTDPHSGRPTACELLGRQYLLEPSLPESVVGVTEAGV